MTKKWLSFVRNQGLIWQNSYLTGKMITNWYSAWKIITTTSLFENLRSSKRVAGGFCQVEWRPAITSSLNVSTWPYGCSFCSFFCFSVSQLGQSSLCSSSALQQGQKRCWAHWLPHLLQRLLTGSTAPPHEEQLFDTVILIPPSRGDCLTAGVHLVLRDRISVDGLALCFYTFW